MVPAGQAVVYHAIVDPHCQPAGACHVPEVHAAFAFEQLAVVPPYCPAHDHVRVVPQAVAPLSHETVPAVHAPAVVEHAPLTEALQVDVPVSHP